MEKKEDFFVTAERKISSLPRIISKVSFNKTVHNENERKMINEIVIDNPIHANLEKVEEFYLRDSKLLEQTLNSYGKEIITRKEMLIRLEEEINLVDR